VNKRSSKSSRTTPPPELPWTWHKSAGWRGQWQRIHRWHSRITKAHELHDAEDFLYAFFQNAYHFRDWLISDNAVAKAMADQLFATCIELRLCGDICNSTKHFVLSRPKQPREFSLAREYRGDGLGNFGPRQSEAFVVLSDGKTYDAIALADICLRKWETFLQSSGLIVQRRPA
jgi:hypothetical protein